MKEYDEFRFNRLQERVLEAREKLYNEKLVPLVREISWSNNLLIIVRNGGA
jgi:hypothetical protein